MSSEPVFLSLEQVTAIHRRSLLEHGGLDGVRDQGGLEAAVAQARNVHLYLQGDLFELASAYAFHLAEAQSYLDGNKRTEVASALVFLEINGIRTTKIEPMELYEPMIQIASEAMNREGLAERMRELFGG